MRNTFYKELFELRLQSQSGSKLFDNRFELIPTIGTTRLLKDNGLSCKILNSRLRIVYQGIQDENSATELYIAGKLPLKAVLFFKVNLKPGLFYQSILDELVAIPAFVGFPVIFHGEKKNNNNLINLQFKPWPVIAPNYHFNVNSSLTGSSATRMNLTVTNSDETIVYNEVLLREPTNLFSALVNLLGLPTDLYSFTIGAYKFQAIVDSAFELHGPQMVIMIKLNDKIEYTSSFQTTQHTNFQLILEE